MTMKQYGRNDGSIVVSATLHALLTENGAHLHRIAFEQDPETTRNFVFGVVVTRTPGENVVHGWDAGTHGELQVHLCYELCEAFPLYEDGAAYLRLQTTVARILQTRVCLAPFTSFQRSIGEYANLYALFSTDTYAAVFRHDVGSILDDKMNVVLARWQGQKFACPVRNKTRAVGHATDATSHMGEWNACFRSIASVFWYHQYVYEAIGEPRDTPFGLCNVLRTYDTVCRKGGGDVRGKLALLDVLKLAYRYNYETA